MAGTKLGGLKAAETAKSKYGKDHFARIGALGGVKSGKGGFWYRKHILGDTDFIREAGRKGGRISKRTK